MNQQILAAKKETVAELNEILKNSHSAIVVSYSKMSVSEVNQLRADLKKAGAKLSVHKNTLAKKAVDEDGLSALDDAFKGPTAIVASVEEGAGLKVLNDFAQAHKKTFAIKAGVIAGTYCDEAKLGELAAIGTKENALASLLSTMQSPLVMFALTLKALAEKGEGAAA